MTGHVEVGVLQGQPSAWGATQVLVSRLKHTFISQNRSLRSPPSEALAVWRAVECCHGGELGSPCQPELLQLVQSSPHLTDLLSPILRRNGFARIQSCNGSEGQQTTRQ